MKKNLHLTRRQTSLPARLCLLICSLLIAPLLMTACDTEPQTKTVTITFDSNGGSTMPAITVKEGDPLPPDYFGASMVPNRTGYEFDCWLYGITPVTSSTTFSQNAMLTAQWKTQGQTAQQVTVNFSLGPGVSGTPPTPVVIDRNTALGINYPANPVRQGYNFTGWFNGATQYTSATAVTTDAATFLLTAQWTPQGQGQQVTVSFNLGGGSGTPPASVTITAGTALGNKYPAQIPTRPGGWDFVGWFNNGTQYLANTIINTTGATFVLTAQWQEEGDDAPEYAQSPAIHPGNHFQETGGTTRAVKVNVMFSVDGLFSNIERGAGVLSSKWYRVTSESEANAATADVPTGTVILEQVAESGSPHNLSLPFQWSEPEAGVFWYYVVVTNYNENATVRQISNSITQNKLTVTVTDD